MAQISNARVRYNQVEMIHLDMKEVGGECTDAQDDLKNHVQPYRPVRSIYRDVIVHVLLDERLRSEIFPAHFMGRSRKLSRGT